MSYMGKAFREFASRINNKIRNKNLTLKGFLIWVAAVSLIQLVIVEMIQRESVSAGLLWIISHFLLFIINYGLVVLINVFFLFLTGTLRRSVIISSILFIVFSVTNLVKKQFLGDPLFPWDFGRIDQVYNLLPKITGEIGAALLLLGLMIIIFIVAGIFLIPRYRLRWRSRLILLVVAAVMIPVLVLYRHTPLQAMFKAVNIENIFWVQTENSLQNGLLLGFAMNVENALVFPPSGYSEEAIDRIVSQIAKNNVNIQGDVTQVVKPDIIIVLDESFWDPTQLPGVTFSEDPLSFFHTLSDQSNSGAILSPVYGGSTANVEFELFTGLSTNYLPQGAIAYQQYVVNKLPSLPSLLKNSGYKTTAIHPYHDWFYDRDIVYPLLGFDSFYSLTDFPDSQKTGEYIGDLDVSKKIIQQLQQAEGPEFIFALTMQNHGPYPAERYAQNPITVSGNLTLEGKQILETYTHGVQDSDNALAYLITYLQKSERPTVVMFFGDHLPFLGKDYQIYKETGYITANEDKWTTEDTVKMKSAPLVIWSNYQKAETDEDVGLISPSFLSAYLLDQIDFNGNVIFKFTRDLYANLAVLNTKVTIDKNNQAFASLPVQYQEDDTSYWLLEYDLLFGKQYALKPQK